MHPKTPTLRPFSKNDWHGFAGAEDFPNGDTPLIGEWHMPDGWVALLVVSLDVTSVMFATDAGDEDENEQGYMLDNKFKSAAEAQAWLALVAPCCTSRAGVLALGFQAW